MVKLLMIHGRAQGGKDSQELEEFWLASWRRGLERAGLPWPDQVEVAFPFYGDRLDELVAEFDAPLVADVVERGASQDTDKQEFRGELLAELVEGMQIPDAEIEAHYDVDVQERGPANWEWVQALLRGLDPHFGSAALDLFVRDVYVYLTVPAVRRAIDAVVAERLQDGPCVVVGHSLGSVVGYNVLRAASGADVRRYVTLGSPLGIKSVQRRLETPLTMPGCVGEWLNAFDERDVVALRALDEEHFPIRPSVLNKGDVRNHTGNRHGITGYLDDAEVARWVWGVDVGEI